MNLAALVVGCLLASQAATVSSLASAEPPAAPTADSPAAAAPALATAPPAALTEQTTITTPDGTMQVTLPAGTKSVLKRPAADASPAVRAGYDGPLVAVPAAKTVDPEVRPASGTAPLGGSSVAVPASGAAPPAADAAAADAAQATAQAAADLITQALTTPKGAVVAGRLSTLMEILARAGGDRATTGRDAELLAALGRTSRLQLERRRARPTRPNLARQGAGNVGARDRPRKCGSAQARGGSRRVGRATGVGRHDRRSGDKSGSARRRLAIGRSVSNVFRHAVCQPRAAAADSGNRSRVAGPPRSDRSARGGCPKRDHGRPCGRRCPREESMRSANGAGLRN